MLRLVTLLLVSLVGSHCGRGPSAAPIAVVPEDPGSGHDAGMLTPSAAEATCLANGWQLGARVISGNSRKVLWKTPTGAWPRGAILVLHGGGGQADHFCTGGMLVAPQIAFAAEAVSRGFAVFVLDATTNVVTDAQGRPCGKRFDFSVLERPNVDLPTVAWLAKELVPSLRPSGSASALFITGLSTGGSMTTRAATHFDDTFTAFAPLSAVDPYGTDTVCDPALSPRASAVGILVDRETRREILDDDACLATQYPNEAPWSSTRPAVKPTVMQFHDLHDGIVDVSCYRKLKTQLATHGYPSASAFLIESAGPKNPLLHLWRTSYNAPLLDFFASFTR